MSFRKNLQYIYKIMHDGYFYFFRNKYNLMLKKITPGIILEWWDGLPNVGDGLAPVVWDWMIEKVKGKATKNVHVMTIGSLLGAGQFDSVVWGTGVMGARNITQLVKNSRHVRLDIRLVRGPLTREFLLSAGYNCPSIYGDPAVLMPDIYMPHDMKKVHEVSVIFHHLSEQVIEGVNCIDIKTYDYRQVIDQIVASKRIVSSSLHGIILAEAYGVPAIFLNNNCEEQSIKYLDWYYSTDRYNVKMASSITEALGMQPMPLPNLVEMKQRLISYFPYDLWR